MRLLIFIVVAVLLSSLAVLAGCAAPPKPEPAVADITLSPRLAAQCAKEGGCTLVSEDRMQRELEGIRNAAFQRGLEAGMRDEAKRRGAL